MNRFLLSWQLQVIGLSIASRIKDSSSHLESNPMTYDTTWNFVNSTSHLNSLDHFNNSIPFNGTHAEGIGYSC